MSDIHTIGPGIHGMRITLWLRSTRRQNGNSSVLGGFLVVLIPQLKSGDDVGKSNAFGIDFSI